MRDVWEESAALYREGWRKDGTENERMRCFMNNTHAHTHEHTHTHIHEHTHTHRHTHTCLAEIGNNPLEHEALALGGGA